MSEAKYTEKLEDEIADLENEIDQLGVVITDQCDEIIGLELLVKELKEKITELESKVAV